MGQDEVNPPGAAAELRDVSHAERRAKVRAAMREAGIEVLVAYGNGLHSFLGTNPAWYLSGFRQMGPHAALVLALDAAPFLLVTPRWDMERAAERASVDDVLACEPGEFLDRLEAEIARRGLASARAGLAGGLQMPRKVAERIGLLFPGGALVAERLVSDIARIRDEWSLLCTRRGVEIAEQGYAMMLAAARTGMYEHELAGELEAYIRGLGAEDNFQLLSASQHNRSVHAPTRRILERGDVLLGEITPAIEGEYIQICRTAVFGGPSEVQQRGFDLLDEALRAGFAAARPGVPVTEVVAAINAPIEREGHGKYTVPPFMRTRGHSMALGSMDPEIAPFSKEVLHKGMVFVMHPNQYLPETGYMMCGEPVIITDAGAVPLTSRMGTLDTIA